MIERGEIWWAEFPGLRGSEPGIRRPVVVVQADSFNESRVGTVVALTITTNLRLGEAPGNVQLNTEDSGLLRESVVNVSQMVTIDRGFLAERVARVPDRVMVGVDAGLRLVLAL